MIVTDQQFEPSPWHLKHLDFSQHMVSGQAPSQPFAAESTPSQQGPGQKGPYYQHFEGRQAPLSFTGFSAPMPTQANMWGSTSFMSSAPQLGSPSSLSSVTSSTPSASSAPGAPASHVAPVARQNYPLDAHGSNPPGMSWSPYDGHAIPQRFSQPTAVAQGYHAAQLQPTGGVGANVGNYHHSPHSHQVYGTTANAMSWPEDAHHSYPHSAAARAMDPSLHPSSSHHRRQPSHPQPPQTGPTTLPVSSKKNTDTSAAQKKQNRHLACNFCRSRKLRCIIDDDEGSVCRQCQRRNLDCSLPNHAPEQEVEVPKAKKRRATGPPATTEQRSQDREIADSDTASKKRRRASGHPGPTENRPAGGESSRAQAVGELALVSKPQNVQACDDRWGARPFTRVSQNSQGVNLLGTFSAQEVTPIIDTALPGLDVPEQFGLLASSGASTLAEMSEADLGVIDEIIRAPPPQPGKGSADWWERCLSVFGPRPQSIRIVENLLSRFVATHNTMMALIHGPSLMHSIRSRPLRDSLHPAVVFAVLTTSVCDLQSSRQEPYLADISTADTVTQRLSRQLRQTAMEYIESSLMDPNGLDVALGQAVSVLVLTSSSAAERSRLFSIVEAVVNKQQLAQTASRSDGLENLPRPGDEGYFSPPQVLESSAAEIKCEAVTRLCKTQAAHAARVVIARPDEDFDQFRLPKFLLNTRAHDYWDPSRLERPISQTYWASRHFSRAASLLSKVFIKVCNLPAILSGQSSADNQRRPDVSSILDGLATVEDSFRWLKSGKQEEASAIYPKEGQVYLVKLHVSTRFSLWRKTGVWKGSEPGSKEEEGLLPSFDWWLVAFSACINKLESDSSQSLHQGSPLSASDGEVESALRHVRLGVQMLTVLEYTHYGIRKLLSKALATLQVQVDLRPLGLCSNLQPLSAFIDRVRGELDAQRDSSSRIVSLDHMLQSGQSDLLSDTKTQAMLGGDLFTDLDSVLLNNPQTGSSM